LDSDGKAATYFQVKNLFSFFIQKIIGHNRWNYSLNAGDPIFF